MRLSTSGESHGKGLFGILEGVPAGLKLEIEQINSELALRQSGYGRGGRQKIERDAVEILSGVRNGVTLGSPVCFAVFNRDYANWSAYMAPEGADTSQRVLTRVRPGHADLTGMLKYGQSDARNVLERASARETAARVAAGSICKQLLAELGIEIAGYVRTVCGISDATEYPFSALREAKTHPLFMLDKEAERRAMAKIDALRADGDTAGGLIEIRVRGLKSGFGSCMTYAEKLDAKLAFAAMSVQAVKGVEIGMGMGVAEVSGKDVHDEIYYDNGYRRKTNRAGGIEGGMSNGEELVLRAAMKPIPTLMRGLDTVDFLTHEAVKAAPERSDVCAVPACAVVLESTVAYALAETVCQRLGGDRMDELRERYIKLP